MLVELKHSEGTFIHQQRVYRVLSCCKETIFIVFICKISNATAYNVYCSGSDVF